MPCPARRSRRAATSGTSRDAGPSPRGRDRCSCSRDPGSPSRATTRPTRTTSTMSFSRSNLWGRPQPPHFVAEQRPGDAARPPRVGALLLEDAGDVVHRVGVRVLGAAPGAVEHRDRHAPRPLARDAPVGTRLDHLRDPRFAERGEPPGRADLAEGLASKVAASIEMNHCGVERKRTGFLHRQQWG